MKTTLLKSFLILSIFSFQFGKTKAQISDSIQIYPNPFDIETNVSFTLISSDTVTIVFYNMLGKVVLQPFTKQVLSNGQHIINILTDSIPYGRYLLRFTFGSGISKNKMGFKGNNTTEISKNINTDKSPVLFPNPTSDLLSIPGEGLKEIQISDLSGKQWRLFKTNLNQISLKELPNGMYNIQILDRDKKLILRENILKVD